MHWEEEHTNESTDSQAGLRGTGMRLGVAGGRAEAKGQEVFIIEQSWFRCSLIDHSLSPGSLRWSEETLVS